MPQHKSAEKRVRKSARQRERNKQHLAKMRTLVKSVRESSSQEDAAKRLNETKSYIDKLVGKGIVKANTAANKKRSLERYVNSLG